VHYLSTGLTVGFIVGFGLLAALTLTFPLVTPPAGALLALMPADAGFGVLAIPRAAGGLAAPVDAGMGFLVGAGLPLGTGFFVYEVGGLGVVLGVGAGRAFWPVFGAPMGLAPPCALTCLVAAADGAGCIDFGNIFREAFVTYCPGAEASGSRLSPYGFVASLGSFFAFCDALAPT
jgi:hypothetical protein